MYQQTRKKTVHQDTEGLAYGWLCGGLGVLALLTAVTGCWALLTPVSFFTTFPLPNHPWVALLPPYNEHLTRDVGEFNLSFTFLFIWSIILCERRLIQVVLVAWLVYAVPHFIYHLSHLSQFTIVDKVAQIGSLAIVILLPIVLLITLRNSHKRLRN